VDNIFFSKDFSSRHIPTSFSYRIRDSDMISRFAGSFFFINVNGKPFIIQTQNRI
jgi:hypothetical protein